MNRYNAKRYSLIPLFLSFGIVTGGVGPTLVTTETSELSLYQAWRLALKNNLTLKQQRLLLQKFEYDLAIEKSEFFPKIISTANYSYTSEIPELELPISIPGTPDIEIQAGTRNRYDFAITLNQPLFTGFRTKYLVAASKENLLSQKARHEIILNEILLKVGELFYQIRLNSLQQKVLKEAIKRVDLHLGRVLSYFRSSQAKAFDTLEVTNEKLQLMNQLKKLARNGKLLEYRLAYLIGFEKLPPLADSSSIEPQTTLLPLDEYIKIAEENRPELEQLQHLRQVKQSQIGIARSIYFPQIYANISYHYARPGVNFFEDEWMDYYSIGVSLQWNIWNWGQSRLQVKRAQLEKSAIDLQTQQILQEIHQEVKEAHQLLMNTHDQIRLNQKLVEQERERYHLTRVNYEQRQATSLDLSSSERAFYEAELKLQKSYIEWYLNYLKLQFVTGTIGKTLKESQ